MHRKAYSCHRNLVRFTLIRNHISHTNLIPLKSFLSGVLPRTHTTHVLLCIVAAVAQHRCFASPCRLMTVSRSPFPRAKIHTIYVCIRFSICNSIFSVSFETASGAEWSEDASPCLYSYTICIRRPSECDTASIPLECTETLAVNPIATNYTRRTRRCVSTWRHYYQVLCLSVCLPPMR